MNERCQNNIFGAIIIISLQISTRGWNNQLLEFDVEKNNWTEVKCSVRHLIEICL